MYEYSGLRFTEDSTAPDPDFGEGASFVKNKISLSASPEKSEPL